MKTRKERLAVEAVLWREIAAKIEAGAWGEWGLCYELYHLPVPAEVRDRMERRVERHMNLLESYGPYEGRGRGVNAFMDTAGEPGARVLAALLLAIECEEEGR